MSHTNNPLPQLIPFRIYKARERVQRVLWEHREPLEVLASPVFAHLMPVEEAMRQPVQPLAPGALFGTEQEQWGVRWLQVEIPAATTETAGRRFLCWDGGGELTVYRDGVPWCGIDWAHKECPVPDEGGTLWISVGLWEGRTPFGIHFHKLELGVRSASAWEVFWDLDVLLQLLQRLYKDNLQEPNLGPWKAVGHNPRHEKVSPLLRQLLRALDDAVDAFDAGGLTAFHAALRAIYARFPAESWQPVAAAHGHAHIDVVWLWPEEVVQHKTVHTFATQLRLMERYPEMTFTQSQPALYRAVERLAPGLMPQVQRRIAEGRWEPTGAAEVEFDTQIPCGEALIRSVLYGQRKLTALRGTPSTLCWIPDVFGYSAVLPTILRLAEVPYFFTTKMTWSAITRFPYNSFVWRGADGSEVLTHLCTTAYVCQAQVEENIESLRAHQQADVHGELLMPHGFGDGGGGVTQELLERARRLQNLVGVPKTRWTTAEAFFDRLQAIRDQLPVYQGELYLEYHRGTYTTQSEYKRRYRAAERALQSHEAARVLSGGAPLGDDAWLRVLLGQFHDALPGTSITLVYQQLNPELQEIGERELAAMRLELSGNAPGVGVFNPLPLPRTVIVDGPAGLAAVAFTGMEVRPLHETPALPAFREVAPRVLDNGVVRAEFAADGQLTGLTVDGTPLAFEAPAHFALFYDEPHLFDAWDIDHYVQAHPRPVTVGALEVIQAHPLRAVLRGTTTIGAASTLTVDYILEAGSRWLRIEAAVAWHETDTLLKYLAPTRYRGRHAHFGNPYGAVSRPQLPGTQQDEAMWEVPGNRWAAVTWDNGEGLALVAEAKYGYSCKEGELGLSLLRASRGPDPEADRGDHHLRFALGRHETETRGTVLSTAATADALFTPAQVIPSAPTRPALFTIEQPGSLVPAWVLPAETGPGYVIRLHETAGCPGVARLCLAAPASATPVNLLEHAQGTLQQLDPCTYEIPYQPYGIVSILVR